MQIDVELSLIGRSDASLLALLDEYRSIVDDSWVSSYFVSFGWVQAWLSELPGDCNVYKVIVSNSEGAVALFFMGLSSVRRSRIVKIQQLALNATGHVEYDNIWIEYNCILCAPTFKFDLESILKKIDLKWEEFCFSGLDTSLFPGNGFSSLSNTFKYIEDNSTVSPYVDLDKVRKTQRGYISLLSANTRSQIRRSLRMLEALGSVELEIPETVDSAFKIYKELVGFHQSTWESRGDEGIFSSSLVSRFHERLIRNRFNKGEIQLLRIRAGRKTVGCLYSFVWKGHVYFYQCGFNYGLGKKVQPGLVSHFLTVQYNVEQGNDVYDFLAGDARYKRSLATDYNKLTWGRVQRKSVKLNFEESLRRLYERFRGE